MCRGQSCSGMVRGNRHPTIAAPHVRGRLPASHASLGPQATCQICVPRRQFCDVVPTIRMARSSFTSAGIGGRLRETCEMCPSTAEDPSPLDCHATQCCWPGSGRMRVGSLRNVCQNTMYTTIIMCDVVADVCPPTSSPRELVNHSAAAPRFCNVLSYLAAIRHLHCLLALCLPPMCDLLFPAATLRFYPSGRHAWAGAGGIGWSIIDGRVSVQKAQARPGRSRHGQVPRSQMLHSARRP